MTIHYGHFDGSTYDAAQDAERLSSQAVRVLALMLDGEWRTIAAIAATVGGSETGVSARLRDFRKPKFGGYSVERQRVEGASGLYEYRVLLPEPDPLPTVAPGCAGYLSSLPVTTSLEPDAERGDWLF